MAEAGTTGMNDLETYFLNNSGNLIHKWKHYFDIYDRHFSRFRNTSVHVLEIGVAQGGSLQMWKSYFGKAAHIYGVDTNPHCKQVEEEQIQVIIGDQGDRRFLASLVEALPRIDILIDDGGHEMEQQIATFEVLFPHLDGQGVYLCEDVHTSYWRRYGGGYHRRGSFIEYTKNLIDLLHAWHSEQPRKLEVTEFTRSANSLHYYDSILVIEKRPRQKPFHLQTGQARVPPCVSATPSFFRRFTRKTDGSRQNG
ncbi:MAG TPA: class I SAM-dependent methyltransferase [Candidatus Acidoferrum sp.]|nr:class I SAM-dependent methyltransferase [Candidatus Acidoferrum sp.]